jgi:hypothetical protein
LAAVNTFTKVLRVRPRSGFRIMQKEITVAASQDIKKHDIVVKTPTDKAYTVQQAISPVPVTNNTGTASGGNVRAYGIALAPITTNAAGVEAITGRTTIPIAVFDDNLEVCMRIYNATADLAEAQDLNLGDKTTTPVYYQFQRWRGTSAQDWWYSLLVTETNGEFRFVERAGSSAPEDDYGLVWVTYNPALRQG